ncbi:MAG: endo-1,4-beta-xylanase [Opitutaceae bacterium]
MQTPPVNKLMLAGGLIFGFGCAPAFLPGPVRRPEAATLRAAAGAHLLIGCAVSSRELQDPRLAALITRQFGCLTAENEMMPAFLVDKSGRFTFGRGDRIVRFARAHRLPLFGHMLLWHHVTRAWLFQDSAGRPLPRVQALANLRRYIDTVVGHYRGLVRAWDVVNEALSDKEGEYLRDTPALRAIGGDYIAKAFEYAHAADPDAELYYNDYNIELPAKRAKALRLLRSLRAQGLRVDAVGIQGHWELGFPKPSVISDAIREFHDAGFRVMITELDVDVLPRTTSGADLVSVETGPDPFPHGLPASVQRRLADRYRAIFEALLKPPGVAMITFWGLDDADSWLNNFPVKGRTNYPLLFNREAEPKPAFFAVLGVLKSRPESR